MIEKGTVINMTNQDSLISVLENNQEMNMFFHTLPQSVRETMIQSGVKVKDMDELKKCAQNFMNNK